MGKTEVEKRCLRRNKGVKKGKKPLKVKSKRNKNALDLNSHESAPNEDKKNILSEFSSEEVLNQFIDFLKKERKPPSREKKDEPVSPDTILIPATVFSRKLGSLETIVKYLHENKKIPLSTISLFLDRHPSTIWTTYKKSIQKHPSPLTITPSKFLIPLKLLTDRSCSVLELLTEYLHDEFNLNFTEIGALLKRSPRTIWTVYDRQMKKRGRK